MKNIELYDNHQTPFRIYLMEKEYNVITRHFLFFYKNGGGGCMYQGKDYS